MPPVIAVPPRIAIVIAGKAMPLPTVPASGRAEATRRRLAAGGVPERRVDRIEGVADREPMYPKDVFDPRNRRVAITLLYRRFAS